MFIKRVYERYQVTAADKEKDTEVSQPRTTLQIEYLLRQAARTAGTEAGNRMRGNTSLSPMQRKAQTLKDFQSFTASPKLGVNIMRANEEKAIKDTISRVKHSLAKEFMTAFQVAYEFEDHELN